MPTKITAPDGTVTTLAYRTDTLNGYKQASRVQSMIRSDGFQIKLNYLDNSPYTGFYHHGWYQLTSITAINNVFDVCLPDVSDNCAVFSRPWPKLTVAKTLGSPTLIDVSNY